jgi:hypothetical protein
MRCGMLDVLCVARAFMNLHCIASTQELVDFDLHFQHQIGAQR